MSDEIERLGKSLNDTSDQLDAYSKAQNAALQQEEQRNKKNDELKKAASDFAKGIGQFSSALMSNVDNQAKYGDSIQSMTNGIAGVVKQIPLVGTVLALLLEAFGAAAKKVLEFNDSLVSANKKLGEVGQSTGLTTDELLNLAHRVGFSTKNLDKYTKVMANMGNSMLYFGKTASEGAKTFTAMAAITEDQREAFTRLGYGTEETLEAIGEYAKLQGTLGKSSAADFKSLKEGTLKYAETLSELSALTGESKKTIQARQQAAANDLKYNLEIQRLRESGQTKVADEMQKLVGVTGAQAEGMRAWMSGAGNTSEAGRRLFRQTNGAVVEIMNQLKSGAISYDQAQKAMAAASENTMGGFGDAVLTLTNYADQVGYNVETMTENRRALNSADAKTVADEVKNKTKSGDKVLDVEAKRINAEIQAGIAYDNIVGLISGPVNSVMQKLFEAAGKLADMISRFISWVKNKMSWFTSGGSSGANDLDFANEANGTAGSNYSQSLDTETVQNPEEAKEMYKYLRGQGLDHNKAVGAVAALQGMSSSDIGGSWKNKVDSLLTSEAGKKYATTNFVDASSAASKFADNVINTDTGWMATGKKLLAGKGGEASFKATGLDALLKTKDSTAAPAQKQMKQGGVLNAPLSGYNVEMHGEEMVIPLGDGRSIPVTVQGAGGISGEVMALMIERLESIKDIIRQSNSTEEEVLRHARNA